MANNSMNIMNTSDTNFTNDVLQVSGPVLVDFWAEWCGPCKALAPKLDEIAGELNGSAKIVKVDIDANPDTPTQYGVRGIPTMILFKGGKVAETLVGMMPKAALKAKLAAHLA